MLALITVALVLASSGARAAPPSTRVVLADPDPELRGAVERALAPWRLEIVVESSVPASTAEAEARAIAQAARFVVWRRDGDLVVFDRERGAAEHREGQAGRLDAVSATASALTVKTLMRLPPLEPATPPLVIAPVITPPPTQPGPELRMQAGGATRVTSGSEIGARIVGAALVRPWGDRGWRFGVAVELGPRIDVQSAGFKGTWSDWAGFALASWTHIHGRWELEPHVALGITRSSLDGLEMSMDRTETATLAVVRGGLWVRWRFGRWSVGASAELDGIPGTPTYSKLMGNGDIFAVPGFATAIGLFVAADLGR